MLSSNYRALGGRLAVFVCALNEGVVGEMASLETLTAVVLFLYPQNIPLLISHNGRVYDGLLYHDYV